MYELDTEAMQEHAEAQIPDLPKADQQRIMGAGISPLSAEFTLKADGTWSLETSEPGRPRHAEDGIWKLAGDTLTLTREKQRGRMGKVMVAKHNGGGFVIHDKAGNVAGKMSFVKKR